MPLAQELCLAMHIGLLPELSGVVCEEDKHRVVIITPASGTILQSTQKTLHILLICMYVYMHSMIGLSYGARIKSHRK